MHSSIQHEIYHAQNVKMPLIVGILKFISRVNTTECSTQLGMKFNLLITIKMLKSKDCSCFITLKCCIYPANNC